MDVISRENGERNGRVQNRGHTHFGQTMFGIVTEDILFKEIFVLVF